MREGGGYGTFPVTGEQAWACSEEGMRVAGFSVDVIVMIHGKKVTVFQSR